MEKLNKSVDMPYVALLSRIIHDGVDSDDRTNVGTMSLFGESLTIDISNNKLPAIGVRRVAPRIAFEELMFMLNGKTQTKELEEKKIFIWKGNTTREFLDNRGLDYLEEGDFGRMYGSQLRNFTGSRWNPTDDKWNLNGEDGDMFIQWFDQLQYIVDEITNNPTSRRIIATHYNPSEAHMGALFPCHIMIQVNIDPKTNSLDLLFWMRSSDVGYGLPYNLMYYGMFAHMLAKLTGYQARKLVYQSGDCHLYKNQIESGMVKHMIENLTTHNVSTGSMMTPTITFTNPMTTLDELLATTWDDVVIDDYSPYEDFKDKPAMAV